MIEPHKLTEDQLAEIVVTARRDYLNYKEWINLVKAVYPHFEDMGISIDTFSEYLGCKIDRPRARRKRLLFTVRQLRMEKKETYNLILDQLGIQTLENA